MALDLFAGNLREHIEPRDEALLQLASGAPDRHPQLAALWTAFHASPRLSARQAGDLAHELLLLLTGPAFPPNPALLRRGVQLAAFFSTAARAELEVRTSSD